MRFPSIDRLLADARRTLARFPFVLLSAGVCTVAILLAIGDVGAESVLLKLTLAGLLGLPTFIALQLWTERHAWSGGRANALKLVAGVALVLYAVSLPDWGTPIVVRRHIQLSLGLHLLVAVLPFAGRRELAGFWEYNKTLFLRLLTAAFYSAVLFIGLAVALVAIDQLLGVHVSDETYLRLWVVIAFVFNSWFFLAGIPEDLAALEHEVRYPTGLKVFAQYILVPIVAVYLVILTVYMGKIVVTRTWPSGWIGYLVSSVSALGILSLLLVYPIQDREENRWIRSYGRWFYVALFPSIVMLLMAIWKRIDQYGVTENRYFIVVLSLWLAGVAAFFALTRSRNIRVIPATLCLLAFVTAAGPWGAYQVAERSQVARLKAHLVRARVLTNDRVGRVEGRIDEEDQRQISAGLDYLLETHGTGSIDRWFEGGLAAIDTLSVGGEPSRRHQVPDRAARIMTAMGLEYVERGQVGSPDQFAVFLDLSRVVLPVEGFDYVFQVNRDALPDTVRIGDDDYLVSYDETRPALSIQRGDEATTVIPLADLLERVRNYPRQRPGVPVESADVLRLDYRSEGVAVRIFFTSLTGREADGVPALESFDAAVYLRID